MMAICPSKGFQHQHPIIIVQVLLLLVLPPMLLFSSAHMTQSRNRLLQSEKRLNVVIMSGCTFVLTKFSSLHQVWCCWLCWTSYVCCQCRRGIIFLNLSNQLKLFHLILQVAACLVRVPTEIVKQRRQAGAASHGLAVVRSTISSEVLVTLLSEGFLIFGALYFNHWTGNLGFVPGLLHHPCQGNPLLPHSVPPLGVLEEATGHSHRPGTKHPITSDPKLTL